MKRFRDAHGNGDGEGASEMISGAEAMRRLRALAQSSIVLLPRGDARTGESAESAKAPDSERATSSRDASTPSTPYLLQRLTALNGSSFSQAASALRKSEGRAELSPKRERTTSSAQQMRAAAAMPSVATAVWSGSTGATGEMEAETKSPRRRARREPSQPPGRGNEETPASLRAGARRGGQSERVPAASRGSHPPAPIGEVDGAEAQVQSRVAAVAKAAVKKVAPATQARKQAARRAPRARPTASNNRKKTVSPAVASGRKCVVDLTQDDGLSTTPPKGAAVTDAALNSPRLSTGSSSLFDDLSTPLRNKARDVEGFLARAVRMERQGSAPVGAGPTDGPLGRATDSRSRWLDGTLPLPQSFADTFRQSTMAPSAGEGASLTLSNMRAATVHAAGAEANDAPALAGPSAPRASAHKYEVIDQTKSRCPLSSRPSTTQAGSEGSIAIPLSRSAQRRLAALDAAGTTVSVSAPVQGPGRLVVVDTSTLLSSDPGVLNLLIEKWTLCIPYTVVDELDNISKGKPGSAGSQRRAKEAAGPPSHEANGEWLRHRARELRDWIASALARKDVHVRAQRRAEVVDEYDRATSSNDDAILGFAVFLRSRGERHVMFVTEDKFLKVKAQTELGECYCYKDIKRMIGVRG